MAQIDFDYLAYIPAPFVLPHGLAPAAVPARVAPPPRPAAPPPDAAPDLPRVRPALLDPATAAGRRFQRALEVLPGAVTWTVITSPLWAGLLLPRPFAVAVLAFDLLWLYLSVGTAWRAAVGYRRMCIARRTDWRHLYRRARRRAHAVLRWEDVRHIVIIPTYKEPLALLRRTLASIAAQEEPHHIVVVLAMELRDQGAGARARALEDEFATRFAGLFATFHPAGLPGEVVGKSANENWAARIAKRRLVDELGYNLDHLTITSCDADTVFHPRYFACLTYKFATDPQRYRRFWQSPILLTNNIWESPAPLQAGSALAGMHLLANLCKRDRVVFPQSTYSLSLRLAHEAGYWDPDVIPEDWHMFLKCYYACGGTVGVEPIYLPTGNDAVRAATTWRSFVEAFRQHQRHAWGVCDIPFAVREMLAHPEMPWRRRVRRVIAVAANHLLWSTHWFLLSIGWWAPWLVGQLTGTHPDVAGLHLAARTVMTACLLPYLALILVDARLRPPRPAWWRARHDVVAALMWLALPITSFLFSTLPALAAQTRLMLGRRLEYRVTEKA